ncbi:MAG: DUF1446 domain-containing protein [bacterium]|nr:DUF1446 domain-containing protein [bacterium]
MKNTLHDEKIIIANCSGFLGDRFSAAKEMIQGGPIDILTGDYLAELTMALLFRMKSKDPKKGYASTFLKQMEEVMGECLDKNIRVISNAGGLNPKALANELGSISRELGINPKIAYIEGDDLIRDIKKLQEMGESFSHLDRGIPLSDANAFTITANAYLGCWGIVKALEEGADIIVGGRIADASIVSGPAAWKFGWKRDDWDKLAGAVTAGHIIECSGQATGGNYSFFEEVPSYKNVGFPIAEINEDGSFIITKHPGTGGLVSVDTVKAQLLYEIREPKYLTPDLAARFDTIEISQEKKDRVKISGVKGEPPTGSTKVCINNMGGYKNSMTVILTGLDIEKKAEIVEDTLFDALGGKDQFALAHVQLIRSDKENPASNEAAFAFLRISIMDPDKEKVGRMFSSRVVELALANIPGFTFTSPPGRESPAIVHWPALISQKHLQQKVVLEENEFLIESLIEPNNYTTGTVKPEALQMEIPKIPDDNKISVQLGRAFATRSGDKGGNANLGVWAKTPEAYAYLNDYLTEEKLKELLTDVSPFRIERYELPNLLALNFYIKGFLGEGAAASVKSDPQAKTLGEYLRARVIEMPESIIVK